MRKEVKKMQLEKIRVKLTKKNKPNKIDICYSQIVIDIIKNIINSIQLTYYGIKLYK